jgi:origin recognition complex subunit 2
MPPKKSTLTSSSSKANSTPKRTKGKQQKEVQKQPEETFLVPSDEDDDVDFGGAENEENQDIMSNFQDSDYFTEKASKIKTSDNTLADIKLLDTKQIQKILKTKWEPTHQIEKEALFYKYQQQFPMWLCEMKTGFNLLFYGFGSKQNLLETFAKQYLADQPTLTVYGYTPTISIKQVNEYVQMYLY